MYLHKEAVRWLVSPGLLKAAGANGYNAASAASHNKIWCRKEVCIPGF